MRRLTPAIVVVLLLVWAPRARADVAEHLQRGKRALLDKRGPEAQAAFEEGAREATTETERWQAQLGLALALVLQDELIVAAQTYRAFLRASAGHPSATADKWKRRRARAAEDLATLETNLLATLARVDVQSVPSGAVVRALGPNGDLPELRTPAVMYLPAGQYNVTLELEGFETKSLPLAIEAGQRPLLYHSFNPVRAPEPPPSPAPSPAPSPEPTVAPSPTPQPPLPESAGDGDSSLFVPAVIVGAAGVLAIVAGAIVHGVALGDADEVIALQSEDPSASNIARDRELRGRIDDFQDAYIAAYVSGGVLLAAGATMFVLDALRPSPEMSLVLSPTDVGVVWQGRF